MKPLSKAQKEALLKIHRLGQAGVRWGTAEVLWDRGLIDREAYSSHWTLTPAGQAEVEIAALWTGRLLDAAREVADAEEEDEEDCPDCVDLGEGFDAFICAKPS